MLDVIIEKCKECKDFGSGLKDLFNFLARYFKDGHIAHALIDAGAVLAGICIHPFAQFLLRECLNHGHVGLKGVTYYENDEWKVMDSSGQVLAKKTSPLHKSDTFVILDEPRCRGVDMKLREDAHAFITIGKEMRKDKFMQAAGRMRQLEQRQSLFIIGEQNIFSEVSRKMHASNNTFKDRITVKVETKDVLNWIMKNTANAMINGISQWAENGLFFSSEAEAKDALLQDHNDLLALYGSPVEQKTLTEIAKKCRNYHLKRTGSCLEAMADEIVDRVNELGDGYTRISSSGADEECERELQREMEEEEEEEVELPSMSSHNEVDWKYETVFECSTAIDACPQCMTLSSALSQIFSVSCISAINWSGNVYGTKNFFHTIKSSGSTIDIDNFLRIPNYFIHFSAGDILLLSDREAQVFLSFKEKFLQSSRVSFCNVEAELCHSSNQKTDQRLEAFLRVGSRMGNLIDSKQIFSLKLFNGESTYSDIESAKLKDMLRDAAKQMDTSGNVNVTDFSGRPESLLIARGKYVDYEKSVLEKLISEIACEFELLNLSS
eukprot:CAMPEP_0176498810 /NCGR_PEP_ID=MMETSP0200_2-20121128/12552_1 /TAXON_ID=947934 /ORGANISM="Chaetoceros sp., Strain GSL56" /LENGTH=550 /DNA_ID=CAMNT_0017897107 /DNA_START=775 /DNA_END=2427 /DNA_ORIENTATION=+